MFVSPGSLSASGYQLTSTSRLIDAGVSIGQGTVTDWNGYANDGDYNVGIDERHS
jgi:hypothetical protein